MNIKPKRVHPSISTNSNKYTNNNVHVEKPLFKKPIVSSFDINIF